jgi:hypothetical protein
MILALRVKGLCIWDQADAMRALPPSDIPPGLMINISYEFLITPMRATFPAHLITNYLITCTILEKSVKL